MHIMRYLIKLAFQKTSNDSIINSVKVEIISDCLTDSNCMNSQPKHRLEEQNALCFAPEKFVTSWFDSHSLKMFPIRLFCGLLFHLVRLNGEREIRGRPLKLNFCSITLQQLLQEHQLSASALVDIDDNKSVLVEYPSLLHVVRKNKQNCSPVHGSLPFLGTSSDCGNLTLLG